MQIRLIINCFDNIKLENLSFTYPNSNKEILSEINIEINKGDIVGLIGTTGSGKSTLLNLFWVDKAYQRTNFSE